MGNNEKDFEKKLENLVEDFNKKFETLMKKRKTIVANFIKEVKKKKEKITNKFYGPTQLFFFFPRTSNSLE